MKAEIIALLFGIASSNDTSGYSYSGTHRYSPPSSYGGAPPGGALGQKPG
jgi:hypothetical protein